MNRSQIGLGQGVNTFYWVQALVDGTWTTVYQGWNYWIAQQEAGSHITSNEYVIEDSITTTPGDKWQRTVLNTPHAPGTNPNDRFGPGNYGAPMPTGGVPATPSSSWIPVVAVSALVAVVGASWWYLMQEHA